MFFRLPDRQPESVGNISTLQRLSGAAGPRDRDIRCHSQTAPLQEPPRSRCHSVADDFVPGPIVEFLKRDLADDLEAKIAPRPAGAGGPDGEAPAQDTANERAHPL